MKLRKGANLEGNAHETHGGFFNIDQVFVQWADTLWLNLHLKKGHKRTIKRYAVFVLQNEWWKVCF